MRKDIQDKPAQWHLGMNTLGFNAVHRLKPVLRLMVTGWNWGWEIEVLIPIRILAKGVVTKSRPKIGDAGL